MHVEKDETTPHEPTTCPSVACVHHFAEVLDQCQGSVLKAMGYVRDVTGS